MITAPNSVLLALQSGSFEYADMYEINIGDAYATGNDTILRYTNCGWALTLQGQTYSPNHSVQKVEGISRKASTGSDEVDIDFAIADQITVAAINARRYANKLVRIQRVILGTDGQPLEDFAIPVRTGRCIRHDFNGRGDSRVCKLTIDSVLGNLTGTNGWFVLDSSHQQRHPGDRIMRHSNTVLTDEQNRRYTADFSGNIDEDVRPPALPVMYGDGEATPVPIMMLRHRHTHTTYRHYFTTFIYVVSIGTLQAIDVASMRMDGERFDFNNVQDDGFDYGGWSLRFRSPAENEATPLITDPQLNFWRQRLDANETQRLSGMIGKGLHLLFVVNRNRDNWIQQPPEFTVPVAGKQLLDPRTGSLNGTAIRNPGLQYYDFLSSSEYGMGNLGLNVNTQDMINLANHFDSLPLSSGNPGINNIIADFQLDTGRPVVENMNIWLETFRLYTSDYYGEFNVRPETVGSSDWDLSESDLRGEVTFNSNNFTDRLNRLTYTIRQRVDDPAPDAPPLATMYIDVESTFPPEGSSIYDDWLAEDGGIPNSESARLENVSVLEQAFYWTMVDARISRKPERLTLMVGAQGWLHEVGDIIRYKSDLTLDVNNDTYEAWRIEEVNEDFDDDEGIIVEFTLKPYSSDFYSPDPNAIPDPVAPAQPPLANSLDPLTGFEIVFNEGENQLNWTPLSASDVVWYAVEIWIDEDPNIETEQLLTNVINEPKVLAPPFSLGNLDPGFYYAKVTPFRLNHEDQFSGFPFEVIEVPAPSISFIASNFEIQIVANATEIPQPQVGVQYELLVSNTDDILTADNYGLTTGLFSIIGRQPNTAYYFWCRTVMSAGISPYNAFSITTSNDGSIYNNLAGFDVSDGKSVFAANIYQRSATAPTTPTGGQFDFDTLTLTPPTGWSDRPIAGSDPLYVSSAIASINGTTGVDTSIPWAAPELLVQDGESAAAGIDGKSVYQAILFQKSVTAPATPADDSASYNFGTNQFDTLPAGWTDTLPDSNEIGAIWATVATFTVDGNTGVDSTQTWTTPDIYVQDGVDGVDGKSVYTFNIYRRAGSTPPVPTGGSYNFGTNAIVVPTDWSETIPSGTGNIYVSTTTASVDGDTGVDDSLTWSNPIQFAKDGADGVDGKSVARLSIYRRSASPLTTPSGGSYNFTNDILTAPTGWSTSIPVGDDPIYSSVALASIQGTSGTDNSITWAQPEILAQNGEDGTNGTTGKSIFQGNLYQRAASQPTKPANNTASYDFGANGFTTIPAGWSDEVPSGTDPIWVVQATFSVDGDTGVDSTQTWSDAKKLAEDGTDGVTGLSVYTYNIYRRSGVAPAVPTGGSYNFGTNTVTPPASWSTTPPGGGEPLYVSTTTASVQGTSGVDSTLTYSTPAILVQNGIDGNDGRSVANIQIFQRTTTPPATPTGGSFAFGSNTLTPPTGWFTTPPAGAGTLYVTYGIASILGISGTDDDIPWGTPEILASDGNDGTAGLSVVQIPIFQRAATLPATPTGGSFNFTNRTLTPPSGWETEILNNSVNPVYVSYGVFSIEGTTGTDTTTTWTSPGLMARNGDNGGDGLSVYNFPVYKRQVSQPSTPSGGSYNFGTRSGVAPAGWSVSVPTTGSGSVWISTATASIVGVNGNDTTLTWTTPSILAQDGADGADGADGGRGAGSYSQLISGSIWSDSSANAVTPGDNVFFDKVTLYNSAGTYVETRYWNGASWVADATAIDGSLIVQNSISATSLKVNEIQVSQIDWGGNVIINASGVPIGGGQTGTSFQRVNVNQSVSAGSYYDVEYGSGISIDVDRNSSPGGLATAYGVSITVLEGIGIAVGASTNQRAATFTGNTTSSLPVVQISNNSSGIALSANSGSGIGIEALTGGTAADDYGLFAFNTASSGSAWGAYIGANNGKALRVAGLLEIISGSLTVNGGSVLTSASGQAYDSARLAGYSQSSTTSNNTISRRNSVGDIEARFFKSTSEGNTQNPASWPKAGFFFRREDNLNGDNDSFMRCCSGAQLASYLQPSLESWVNGLIDTKIALHELSLH